MSQQDEVIREIVIGEFILVDNGKLFWLCRDDGEGMSMNEETLKKFEKVIREFYEEHF